MKTLFNNFWFALLLGLAILDFAGYAGKAILKRSENLERQIKQLQEQNEALKNNQSLMVWTMDKSCADQLKNNIDKKILLTIQPLP